MQAMRLIHSCKQNVLKLKVFMVTACTFVCLYSSAQNVTPSISDPKLIEQTDLEREKVFASLIDEYRLLF